MLVRLIYASRPAHQLGIHAVNEILKVSKKNNARDHITGALVYSEHVFLQCLEGPRNEVNIAYQRISKDTRHTDCLLLQYTAVDSRLFTRWDMGNIQFKAEHNPIVLKYSDHDFFDPYNMNSNQCEMFMKDLAIVVSKSQKQSLITQITQRHV